MDTKEVLRIAQVAAARYARRCWWASVEDMKSEAVVAILAARGTWDPEHGAPFGAYAYRAALLAIRPYLWRNSSPVSESFHKLPTLAGAHRASLEKAGTIQHEHWSNDLYEEWHDSVEARIAELDPTGIGRMVLVYKEPVEAVAEALAVPIPVVKKTARALRASLSGDVVLWKLHRKAP